MWRQFASNPVKRGKDREWIAAAGAAMGEGENDGNAKMDRMGKGTLATSRRFRVGSRPATSDSGTPGEPKAEADCLLTKRSTMSSMLASIKKISCGRVWRVWSCVAFDGGVASTTGPGVILAPGLFLTRAVPRKH
jgi:hypothetical protein